MNSGVLTESVQTGRDDATTVIQREEWPKSRQDVEKHFRKLRDLDYLNWL